MLIFGVLFYFALFSVLALVVYAITARLTRNRPDREGLLLWIALSPVLLAPYALLVGVMPQIMLSGTEVDRGSFDRFYTPIGAGLSGRTHDTYGDTAGSVGGSHQAWPEPLSSGHASELS